MGKQSSFVYFTTIFNLFYIIIVSRLISCSNRNGTFRALGGRDARPNEFPYILRMEKHMNLKKTGQDWIETIGQFHCTVSVLSSTVSLTAAHCCESIETPYKQEGYTTVDQKVVIRYSASNRPSKDDRFFEVFSCKQHPTALALSHPMKFNDVGLLATQPILLSKYGKLSALDYDTLYGKRVTILGYGIAKHADTLTLNVPLQVVDAILSRCSNQRDDDNIFPNICAVKACGTTATACPGDSGGPILHSSGIVGIISGGVNLCQYIEETIYSPIVHGIPVSIYIDWLGYNNADMANTINNNHYNLHQ